VTFHTRIKSSGYGQPDEFTKWRQKQQKKRTALASRAAASAFGEVGKRIRMYPLDCSVPIAHQKHLDWSATNGEGNLYPIRSLAYNEDGSSLGSASNDTAVIVMRINSGKPLLTSYMGHDGRISSVCFSHRKSKDSGHYILSSSVDGTVRVWNQGRIDHSALVLSHTIHGHSSGSSQVTKTSDRNRPFGAEIIQSRFFYMDEFILIAVKSNINMYTYKLDPSPIKETGLKSMYSDGHYKRAHQWSLPSQCVGTFSCVNSVHSHLILAAGSDKSIFALDGKHIMKLCLLFV
jgi:WD40 repeat protein